MPQSCRFFPLVLIAALLCFPFQTQAMFGGRETKKTISSSERASATTEGRRREAELASEPTALDDESASNQAAQGDVFLEVPSEQNNRFGGTERAAAEDDEEEQEEVVLALAPFRIAAARPELARAERLIIDSGNGEIRAWKRGDSGTSGKNETILAALQAALEADIPSFSAEKLERLIQEELPASSSWSMLERVQKKPDLSTTVLQRILDKADKIIQEEAFVEKPASFTLQKFRDVLNDAEMKGRERLIMSGKGIGATIVAKDITSHKGSKNQTEEKAIRQTLKRALEKEGHPKAFVHQLTSELLPRLGILSRKRAPLSFEKLQTIIQRADDAMAEVQLTRSVAPPSSRGTQRAATRTFLRGMIAPVLNSLGIENEAFVDALIRTFIPRSNEEVVAEHTAAAYQAAWEEREVENILRSIIFRDRTVEGFKEHYREAEEAAIAAENAQQERMQAGWNAKKKKKFLTEARGFFDKAKAALEEKQEAAAFDESTLNKIAQAADFASIVLDIANPPFVNAAGIASAISAFATYADQRLTIADARAAHQQLQEAIKEAEAATEGHEQLEEEASSKAIGAEQMERNKKKEDHDEIMNLATLLRLPSDLADEAALREWAKELACESNQTNAEQAKLALYLLYKHAKNKPDQLHEVITKLWGERVAHLEQEVDQGEETSPEAIRLREKHRIAHEQASMANEEAYTLQNKFQVAREKQNEWLSKRDQLRSERDVLEDQLLTAAKPDEVQNQIHQKRAEITNHDAEKVEVNSTYKVAAVEAKRLTTLATKASADAFKKLKLSDAAKTSYDRLMDRLKAVMTIEQKILSERLIIEDRKGAARAQKAFEGAEMAEAALEKLRNYKASERYSEVASALGDFKENGAVSYYNMAAEAEVKGHSEKARAYRRAAQAREKEAELLEGDNQVEAARYYEIAYVLGSFYGGAADYYGKAVEEEAKGNRKAGSAYRRAAQAREKQADLLEGDNREEAVRYNQIAEALGGSYGVAEYYSRAVREEAKKNKGAARAYRQAARARERQTELLRRGVKQEAGDYKKILITFEAAADYYGKAVEEEAKGNRKAGSAYRRAAQASEKTGAFLEGNQEQVVKQYNQIEEALVAIAGYYKKVVEEEAQGRSEAAMAYREAAQAREKQVEFLKNNKPEEVTRYNKVALALGGKDTGAAAYYKKAAEAEAQSHREATNVYRKAARAREKQAEFLKSDQPAEAECFDQIADLLGGKYPFGALGAAQYYSKAAEAEAKGRSEAAMAYREAAQAREKQVEFLKSNKPEEAELYNQIADALGGARGAAACYINTVKDEPQGLCETAKDYRLAAQAREMEVDFLKKRDQQNAKYYSQIAEALGGGARSSQAVEYYRKAVLEEAHNHKEVARIYHLAAQLSEKIYELFQEHKSDTTEKLISLGEIKRALIGEYGAADHYNRAIEAEAKGQDKIASTYRLAAQAREMEADFLKNGNRQKANYYRKIARTLGSEKWGERIYSGVVEYYRKAVEAEAKGNKEVARAYRRAAQAKEKQVDCFKNDKKEEEARYNKIEECYDYAAEEGLGGYDEAAMAYHKAAQAGQREAEFFERASQEEVNRYEEVVKQAREKHEEFDYDAGLIRYRRFNTIRSEGVVGYYRKAAENYRNAAKADARKEEKIATVYRQAAQYYEAEAVALAQALKTSFGALSPFAQEDYNEAEKAEVQIQSEAIAAHQIQASESEARATALDQSLEAISKREGEGSSQPTNPDAKSESTASPSTQPKKLNDSTLGKKEKSNCTIS